MPNKTCCQDKAPVTESFMSLDELDAMFFGRNNGTIAVNTLSEHILSLNMLTVDLRLLMRLVQLRTAPDTQQPMYWAQPMLEQLLRARAIDIRKLTEPHKPNQPRLATLSFPHVLAILDAHHANPTQHTFLAEIHTRVKAQHQEQTYMVNKYIVHAATVESRATDDAAITTLSVAHIWQCVLVLNHVFYALFRYVQQERDMCAYPHTLRNHVHDMQRYFLLTEPETISLRALLDESMRALDAIQSGSAPAPWETATP